MSGLSDFVTSRVRVKVLTLFCLYPAEMFYIREVTREIGEEINAVRRELNNLLNNGILKTEERGNRVYYYLNKSYGFFPELQQMVLKDQGLGEKIRKSRRKLGEIQYVMFTSQLINRRAEKNQELDLLLVGEIVLPELELLVKEEEKKLGREINYMVLNPQEFRIRKQRRDPFIMDVMYGKKIMIIGDEEEFVDRQIL